MIGERRNNRENADLIQLIHGLTIDITLFGEVEEGIVVVIHIVNADFENTLTFVFSMRFDKLHTDIQMMERFHAEIVLLAVIFNITIILVIIIIIVSMSHKMVKIILKRFGSVKGGGQRDGVASRENP